MSTVQLRRKIKSEIDRLPPKRLELLADYIRFLSQPPLVERVAAAEKAIAAGKGVNWRKVRLGRQSPSSRLICTSNPRRSRRRLSEVRERGVRTASPRMIPTGIRVRKEHTAKE